MAAEYGVVALYKLNSGYGFVTPNKPGRDLYFHAVMVVGDAPAKGDTVKFVRAKDRSGRPCAIGVEVSR